MSDYRTRNQLLLAKVQADAETEATPDPSTDAVKVRFPIGFAPNLQQLDTDFVTGSLSNSPPIVGGGNAGMSPRTYLKGAGTAGQAPDWGVLARGCGMSETLTAAPVAGTAAAGDTNTITLDGTASAVDDAYRGMVIRITGGNGAGQVAVISAYDGSTKVATVVPNWSTQPDATSEYSIDANALYRPVSQGLEVLTLHAYQHHNTPGEPSRRSRLMSAAGNLGLSIPPRGLGELNFTFTGILPAVPDDVAKPSDPVYQAADPAPFLNAQAYLGGAPVKINELTFDLGAAVDQPDNPATAFGFDAAGVTQRVSTGRIVAALTKTSTRNAFQDMVDGTPKSLWVHWGPAAGKRISLFWPEIRYTGNEQVDVRGFAAEGIPIRSVAPNAEIFICVS